MPPDFSGQTLRGRSFKGQDLSEASFSYANIQGADFTDANLRNANFAGAKAGIQRRWIVGQWIILLLLSSIAGVFIGYAGVWYLFFLYPAYLQTYSLLPAIALVFAYLSTIAAVAYQGLTPKAAMTVAIVGAGAIAVAGAVAVAGSSAVELKGAIAGGGGAIAGGSARAAAGVMAIAVAVVLAGAIAASWRASAVAGLSMTAVAVAIAGPNAVIGVVPVLLLSLYVARQAHQGNDKFALVRSFSVQLESLGGTRFCGADLTEANFTAATLQSADFSASPQRPTALNRVCWKEANQLARARVEGSILADAAVRDLLITLNGYKKRYSKANLRGANLSGVNLSEANLKWADLSEASLQRADLRGANLTETLAIGTDFSAAALTGACLQAWNIDSSTQLSAVDCQYVFLLEQSNALGNRERRPHDPNKLFQPGDFETYFKEVLDTVQILIRDGINPEAFRAAMQTVLDKYPDATVRGIEKQDQAVLLTLKVPEGTDKAEVEQNWDQVYQARLEAQTAAARLEVKQQQVDDLKAITLATVSNLGHLLSNLTISNTVRAVQGDASMTENSGININAAGSIGDVSGLVGGGISGDISGVVNLGEISGMVTNSLIPLQNSDRPEAKQLADLLQQLQAAIEAEPDLPLDDKTEALEQVSTLAKAGQNPQDGTLQKLSGTAVKVIKGTIAALPDTAKLVEACGKLLPAIVSLLGL